MKINTLNAKLLVACGLSDEASVIVMDRISELEEEITKLKSQLSKANRTIDELNERWIEDSV